MGIRSLAIASILLGGVVFGWGTSQFASYLAANRPKQPEPTTGRTLERKFKGGAVVYISWRDEGTETTINFAGIVLVLAGIRGLARGYPASPKA